jgi:uncharacterized membrane protein
VIGGSGSTAQLDLHTLLHQPGKELSVGIPGINWMTGLNMTIGVIGIVVQNDIGSVAVKDGNNFTGDPRIIAYAQRLVTLTDWIFTAGGVVLILVGAYGMAAVAGLNLRGTTWLVWGQALFAVSGLIWVFILIPTQIAQARQARLFARGTSIPDSYWRHNRRWVVWGVIATLVPMANLYFMVFKP